MTTHPSSTWNIAGYGSSSSSRPASPDSTKRKQRRDSTAPLMHTPPVATLSSPSSHISHPNINDLHSSGLYRRRHNSSHGNQDDNDHDDQDDESETETEDDDDEEDDGGGSDTGSSDKGDTSSTLQQTDNDIRISGLGKVDPWRQTFMLDEEVEIIVEGYQNDGFHYMLYRLLCILSCGVVWLICRWMPQWWISWVGRKASLANAQWLVFVVRLNQYVTWRESICS